ncbi:MAG: inosine/xanthosine triphosphatase [Dehalococcoidia bacterium]|nr:inosine/xanthosine triphosphatase [Dehalococcoidia bacterium]
MAHVVVGSTNSGKVNATRRVFRRAYGSVDLVSLPVASGVGRQPLGDECFVGAYNRAVAATEEARTKDKPVDFAVGIEGGLLKLHERWFGVSVACVVDSSGSVSYGTSPLFQMPDDVVEEVAKGTELGDIMIRLSGDASIRQRQGAVGFLTRGLLTREAAHETAVAAALAPHLSPERYQA